MGKEEEIRKEDCWQSALVSLLIKYNENQDTYLISFNDFKHCEKSLPKKSDALHVD